jgi:hypothetical protein
VENYYIEGNDKSKSITYTKFQFIEVKCDNILKYIDKKFDLSFCKVCFDGENITVMNNINDIFRKKGRIDMWNKSKQVTKKRIDKYKNRGFDIKTRINILLY